MRRLDGLSAYLLQSDAPHAYQHTLKIGVMNFSGAPGGYDFEKLLTQIESGLNAYPLLKWKVAKVPFELNHPFWVQDLEFDISHHVRRIACPAPGDKDAFCSLISELYAQQLPRELPLWVIWIIEGLEDNQVGMVAMLHHAYTDGVGVSIMLQGLGNPEKRRETTSEALGVDSQRAPGSLSLLLHGLIELPEIFIREIPFLMQSRRKLRKMEKAYLKTGKQMPPNPGAAPDSPFNVALSHRRSFYYHRVDLAILKAISKHFGVTVNDLLIAAVCGAVRQYYQDHSLSTEAPLVATIPFSMRDETQKDLFIGNFVSNSCVSLPIQVADPLERLMEVQKSAQAMKAYVKATGGGMSYRVTELIPPFATRFMSWLLRRREGRLHPFGNMAISNVQGPREPLRVGDAKITNWLSSGHLPESVGLNITAWSYVDTLNICMMADKAVIPNGKSFINYVESSIQQYTDLMVSEYEGA